MPDIGHVIGPTIMLFFGALVLIIAIVLTSNYFNNRLKFRTVQAILINNKDLTPEQIYALFKQESDTDLRKGLIGMALAFASIVFGLIMGASDYQLTQTSFIGMAMFPGLVGLTYLFFHFKNQ
ncbi:MAG: DUF6249 domain-containing protein [Cognaticolwellia sp.]